MDEDLMDTDKERGSVAALGLMGAVTWQVTPAAVIDWLISGGGKTDSV